MLTPTPPNGLGPPKMQTSLAAVGTEKVIDHPTQRTRQ